MAARFAIAEADARVDGLPRPNALSINGHTLYIGAVHESTALAGARA